MKRYITGLLIICLILHWYIRSNLLMLKKNVTHEPKITKSIKKTIKKNLIKKI